MLLTSITIDGDHILLTLGFHLAGKERLSGKDLIGKCKKNGVKSLEHVEGEFVSIFSEGSTRSLHIVNDRFGSRPMFLLETHSEIYFSSNFVFLQYFFREEARPDIIGYMQLFSYGHTIGERTIIEDIKRIQPASHMILTPQQVKKKRYWNFEYTPDENLLPNVYCETVFDAFKTATLSRVKIFGNGLIALSGGLDSRLLSGALPVNSGSHAFTRELSIRCLFSYDSILGSKK